MEIKYKYHGTDGIAPEGTREFTDYEVQGFVNAVIAGKRGTVLNGGKWALFNKDTNGEVVLDVYDTNQLALPS